MSARVKLLPLILAERIIDLLNESGASEAEKHVAIAVAKAVIPVLNGSVCVDPEEGGDR